MNLPADNIGQAKIFKRNSIGAAVIGALLLQGCSIAQSSLRGYDDPNDACNIHRQPIIESRSTEEQDRIVTALATAAVAGLATGLIAAATGDDKAWQKGLIAAAVGGLAGYSYQYLKQKAEKAADEDALLRSVDADAKREAGLVSQVGKSVAALQDCREGELATLRSDFKAKTVSRELARDRLAEIQGRIETDNALIAEAFESSDQRVNSYVDATATTVSVERDLVYRPKGTKKPQANREQRRAARKVQKLSPNVQRTAAKNEQAQTVHQKRDEQLKAEVSAMNELLA